MDGKTMKDISDRKVDEIEQCIWDIADYLHSHPELGTQEVLARPICAAC